MIKIIGGTFRSRTLYVPKGDKTRPSAGVVRECLFNVFGSAVEGARVLDLFAGSGAVGFEALSRGAQSVTFVEKDREAVRAIFRNVGLFDVDDQVTVMLEDALRAVRELSRAGDRYDLIFVDPPYQSHYAEKALKLIDRFALLAENGTVFLEWDRVPSEQDLHTLRPHKVRKCGATRLIQYFKKS